MRTLATRLLVAMSLLAAAPSCGGDRYIVVGSARVPATSGYVTIADASADSAQVTVHLEQLQPARNLDPVLNTYVVWFEPVGQAGGKPVRAGTLRYQPDQRLGELTARSPFGKFVVKVTAEANDSPAQASDLVVVSQEIALED